MIITKPREVIFIPLAEIELKEGFDWYERKQSGTGRKFEQAIDEKLNLILENPKAYRIGFRGWREAVIRKFPYNILFREVEPGLVVVSAIFNTSRNPRKKYWRWPIQ